MIESSASSLPGVLIRLFVALLLTVGLLLFLAALRLNQQSEAPLLTIRSLETIQPISLPAPPPPPETDSPPPPPEAVELTRLDFALDPVAPPIKATVERREELRLPNAEFARQVERPRSQMTFTSDELDSQPKLVSRPSVTFPKELLDRGVSEGKVTLEVLITSSGSVRVHRTLDSSHTELIAMARSFASGSRFTPPNKDGRTVNALFRWPLLLRP
jgi:hypothetical protein